MQNQEEEYLATSSSSTWLSKVLKYTNLAEIERRVGQLALLRQVIEEAVSCYPVYLVSLCILYSINASISVRQIEKL